MVAGAALIGALSAVAGLRGALAFDTPAGPSIVCAAALAFVLTGLARGFRRS
jgi:zinc transport system permease protein